MQDAFGREINYLRVSLTDRCNFRCTYCMPKEIFGKDYEFLARDQLLSFEEITRIASVFASEGVTKIRLTGGEPLLRKGIEDLIAMLAEIEGLERLDDLVVTGPVARGLADAAVHDEVLWPLGHLRVEWEFEDGSAQDFVFTVASSMTGYHEQVARYRTRLGGWFALLTVILGAAQLVILRFVLKPLRQAEREVGEIETGQRERLSEGYPAELEALAGGEPAAAPAALRQRHLGVDPRALTHERTRELGPVRRPVSRHCAPPRWRPSTDDQPARPARPGQLRQ